MIHDDTPTAQMKGRFPRPQGNRREPVKHSRFDLPSQSDPPASMMALQARRQTIEDLKATTNVSTSTRSLGAVTSCPGCRIQVGLYDLSTVDGPEGLRWHPTCLICGQGTSRGCGKRLDSAAKSEGGTVLCRNCLVSSDQAITKTVLGPQPYSPMTMR